MKKRITAAILSLCMIVLLLPATAHAADTGDSEANAWDVSTSGDMSVKAYYEQGSGFDCTLFVTGSGSMKDYSNSALSPWDSNGVKDFIVSVEIKNGVTGIGSYAFYNCGNLSKISIPESVVSVKGNSFPAHSFTINYEADNSDHEFIGWYDNAGFSGNPVEPTAFSETATYYAKWESAAVTPSTDEQNPQEPADSEEPSDQDDASDDNNDDKTSDPSEQPATQKEIYDTSKLAFEDVTVTFDGKLHSIEATGIPDGVTVTYEGNGVLAAGVYTVKAKFTGDDQHEPIADMEAKLTIEKASQDIAFGYETLTVLTTDKPFTNQLAGIKEQAAVSYEISDTKVATVDENGEVTVVGEGTAVITATTAETADYKQTVASYTLTVAKTLDEADKEDGETLLTTEYPNGVKVSVPEEQGKVKSAVVTVPEEVERAVVTIPMEDVTYGTVAMNAKTGEILKLCAPVSDGLEVEVNSTVSLILFDNSKIFTDISGHWGEKYIDFCSAHNLFAGTSDTTFEPDISMTRGMMMTVIARFNGVDVSGGSVWYERGMNWAKAMGVSDGTNPEMNITREQVVAMLYRYSGSPDATKSLSAFSDAQKVSSWATDAMKWAVENGIIHGTGNGTLIPRGNATRAQIATIMTQYCYYLLDE